jgi:hypothetical protein
VQWLRTDIGGCCYIVEEKLVNFCSCVVADWWQSMSTSESRGAIFNALLASLWESKLSHCQQELMKLPKIHFISPGLVDAHNFHFKINSTVP